ncbi:MAG: DUF4390 domain-containing protein [Nitrospirota bacterium]
MICQGEVRSQKSEARAQVKFFIPGFIVCLLLPVFWILPSVLFAAEITDINVRLANSELFVSTALKPDPKTTDDLSQGISKEFTFYIDLFRVWNVWPDEFVLGKKIVRILKSDQIKREYVATSISGQTHLEKRFKDLNSMMEWARTIPELKLTSTKELEPGLYFVKVTIESRIRKLPAIIRSILIFVPEHEFRIFRDSPAFMITAKGTP